MNQRSFESFSNYQRCSIKRNSIATIPAGGFYLVPDDDGKFYADNLYMPSEIFPSELIRAEEFRFLFGSFFVYDYNEIKNKRFEELFFTPAIIKLKKGIYDIAEKGKIEAEVKKQHKSDFSKANEFIQKKKASVTEEKITKAPKKEEKKIEDTMDLEKTLMLFMGDKEKPIGYRPLEEPPAEEVETPKVKEEIPEPDSLLSIVEKEIAPIVEEIMEEQNLTPPQPVEPLQPVAPSIVEENITVPKRSWWKGFLGLEDAYLAEVRSTKAVVATEPTVQEIKTEAAVEEPPAPVIENIPEVEPPTLEEVTVVAGPSNDEPISQEAPTTEEVKIVSIKPENMKSDYDENIERITVPFRNNMRNAIDVLTGIVNKYLDPTGFNDRYKYPLREGSKLADEGTEFCTRIADLKTKLGINQSNDRIREAVESKNFSTAKLMILTKGESTVVLSDEKQAELAKYKETIANYNQEQKNAEHRRLLYTMSGANTKVIDDAKRIRAKENQTFKANSMDSVNKMFKKKFSDDIAAEFIIIRTLTLRMNVSDDDKKQLIDLYNSIDVIINEYRKSTAEYNKVIQATNGLETQPVIEEKSLKM